ncbi:NAD(P)-dependent alcohol dehydrogenase [Actinophytocola algeriensis]|uniref:NADPH:quinone reductase-like Zn-dependent oxidoreductase n=1 Tax=Actinophytocola algeriensis TaxID=1768010 RepID=A0A7W7Q622_9PSEU|nr:NAD(P)-dependent alcohol dehydrogenase [Actinophytocola algeriensis]MBB4907731.1 NADPH:quinone reductase-like Zn-dependent oxidoreductase [Actinophytocola algeriensis]MBE1479761.1 NADPH:quinone reductase-like Zn-dependent oxidoreductase [Actinophytocola algeriensis]
MKAIAQDSYGGPEALEFRDVPTPVAGDDEVLVEVRAAALNAWDWHMMRGDPYFARLMTGAPRRPKRTVRGRDLAGVVAAVGGNVTEFRPGDEVYGDLGAEEGAFAEYASVPGGQLARKPANLTFEQAAAVPLAANTALMGLRDAAGVQAGQRVLVNGASGGVGTFAVQLAKSFGAHVTGVCRTRNAGLVRELGADEVVDYTRDDFTTRRYDVVLDLVGNRSLTELRRAAGPRGVVVLSGGGVYRGGSVLGPVGLIMRGQLLRPFVRQRLVVLGEKPSTRNLDTLRELIEAGSVTPVIDRTYPLPEAAAAIRYLEEEHARAKVVLTR